MCFVHPDDKHLCVKVRRPDFTLRDLRKRKGFPKTLRPLSSFDDNLEEFEVLSGFQKKYGDKAFEHISHCSGFQETDLGKGLVSELIRDHDGRISLNIKQYIWEEGVTDSFLVAFETFCAFWLDMAIPSRSLLIHNVIVQKGEQDQVSRLVVIDGLGYPGIIPEFLLPKSFYRKKAARKIDDLRSRMDDFINECGEGKTPTPVGIMLSR